MSTLKVGTIQDHANSNNALVINSAGVVTQPAKPMFHAKGADNQALANDTWVKAAFNSELFDIGGYFNTSTYRYQPLVAGKYLITGKAYITYGGAATENIRISIYKNGSNSSDYNDYGGSTQSYGTVLVTSLIDMNGSSDYLEIYLRQNTSTDAVYYSSGSYGEFSGFLVG